MKKNSTLITAEQLKKVFRYELKVQDVFKNGENGSYRYEKYFVQWDDFVALLTKIKKDKITGKELDQNWWWAVEAIDSDEDHYYYLSAKETERYFEEEHLRFAIHPVSQIEGMLGIIFSLMTYIDDFDLEYGHAFHLDIDLILHDIELMKQNNFEDITPELWDEVREDSVLSSIEDNHLGDLSEQVINWYRKALEAACLKGDTDAVEAKAYCFYGGNRLYDCDWNQAEKMFKDMMENKKINDIRKAKYANSLGYIYYYGRTTEGKPDYDQAFKYFSIGAFNGYYESCYKLADMFQSGKGTIQNDTAAFNLVKWVLGETRDDYLRGNHSNFADAALRMGNMFEKGIVVQQDDLEALTFYLLAKDAIDKRMANEDNYGDEKVAMTISEALKKIEEKVPYEARQSLSSNTPVLLDSLLQEDYSARFEVKKTNNKITLTAKRLPLSDEDIPLPVLVVVPESRHVEICNDLTYHLNKVCKLSVPKNNHFIADEIVTNKTRSGEIKVEFLLNNKVVATIIAQSYTFKFHQEKKKVFHRIAKVVFEGSDNGYDYLCDDLEVNPGDKVVVEVFGKRKVVTVRSVDKYEENDLPLEFSKYKKIKEIVLN